MARDDDQKIAAGKRSDGGDEVSRLQRERGGGEEPPPALDAIILRAAREALQESTARPSRRRVFWPLAASLLLSTTAVLMFSTLDGPRRTDAPVVAEDRFPSREREAAAVLREAAPQTADVERAAPSRPPPNTLRAEAARAPEAQPVQENGLSPAQEEIIVTGSRIRQETPEPSSPLVAEDYRTDPESWRAAILALQEEGREEDAQAERELFLQRYPGQDPNPRPEAQEEPGR